jgi:restriction endonuclease S subunit
MNDGLPQGWCGVAISDVAEVFLGKTPARTDYASSGNLKVVKFRDIQDGRVDFANAKDGFVRNNRGALSGLRELRRGDVLITSAAHSGENIGKKCAYVSSLPEKFARIFFTGELLNIRCPDETLGRWAYLFFRSTDGFSEIQEAVTGVHLTGGRAKQMRIPLAPLGEQRRIVPKLEKLLGKVDTCQERLAKIPVLIKRFRQSVLAAACSGCLTADWREENPVEDADPLAQKLAEDRQRFWERRELAKMVATGKQPKHSGWKRRYKQPFAPSDDGDSEFPETWKPTTVSQVAFLDVGFAFKSSEFTDTGVKLLRGENLEPGRLRWSDTKCWPENKLRGLEHLLVDQGEIILALDRPVISSGLKIARATKADLPCLLVQRMMRFKMVEAMMTLWLYFNLRIPAFISHLTLGLTGSDLPHVTGTGVAEYTFGLPPLAEQQEIVRRVEALFALADQIEARYAKAKAHVEKLNQSILAKAFRGELVPQDPNDEPASALLERINEDRARTVAKSRKSA